LHVGFRPLLKDPRISFICYPKKLGDATTTIFFSKGIYIEDIVGNKPICGLEEDLTKHWPSNKSGWSVGDGGEILQIIAEV